MRNRYFAAVLIALFGFLQMPQSSASQVPVLTWEQGKVESVTLGGYVSQTNYRLFLTDLGKNEIPFSRSALSKGNYYIYSINLSNNIHVGSWFIKMSDAQKTIIAGVKIIPQGIANPVQTPIKLEFVLAVLAWLVSFLSITKMRAFAHFEYFFSEKADRGPGLLRRLYRLRRDGISSLSLSLGQLLLDKESEYLYRFSSILWLALPGLGLALGLYDASKSLVTAGILTLPVTLILLTALLGLVDPFSGFIASIGFSSFVILAGHVTSIRAVVSLITLSLIWFLPSLLIVRIREAIKLSTQSSDSSEIFSDASASIFGGLLLSALMIVFNSLLDKSAPVQGFATQLGTLFIGISFLKLFSESRFIERHLKKNNQLLKRTVEIGRIINPRTIVVAASLALSVLYIWTQSIIFSSAMAILLALTLSLLLIRLTPKSYIKSKLLLSPRRVIVEPTLISTFLLATFFALKSAAYLALAKGEIFIAITLFSLFIHGVYSLLVDSTDLELNKVMVISE